MDADSDTASLPQLRPLYRIEEMLEACRADIVICEESGEDAIGGISLVDLRMMESRSIHLLNQQRAITARQSGYDVDDRVATLKRCIEHNEQAMAEVEVDAPGGRDRLARLINRDRVFRDALGTE